MQCIGINACADGFGSEPGKGVKRIAQGFALFGFYPAALGVEFVERGGVSGGKLFQGRLKAVGGQGEGGFQAVFVDFGGGFGIGGTDVFGIGKGGERIVAVGGVPFGFAQTGDFVVQLRQFFGLGFDRAARGMGKAAYS